MSPTQKPIIYQLIPRLFANYCETPVENGTIRQNGSGKLAGISTDILRSIRDLGVNYVWYTGVIDRKSVV